jgi:hypothetical protein
MVAVSLSQKARVRMEIVADRERKRKVKGTATFGTRKALSASQRFRERRTFDELEVDRVVDECRRQCPVRKGGRLALAHLKKVQAAAFVLCSGVRRSVVCVREANECGKRKSAGWVVVVGDAGLRAFAVETVSICS